MPTMKGDRTGGYHRSPLGGVLESSLAGGLAWRRSSQCNAGNCVEVAAQGDVIMVRSSADPEGVSVTFSCDTWREWISRVKEGVFDEA
jgi:hypothetical protein